ncbi:hypothetical protein BVY02_00350 [bacterium J17]|nr:hypothetical protein BVY02_00350 [bacterium J17]
MKVGILGGGQLARMMILDGLRLGLSFRVYDESKHSSTEEFSDYCVGALDDKAKLLEFSKGLDVVTCEFENIPASTLEIMGKNTQCYPPYEALAAAQDRLDEKKMLQSLGIATAEFYPVSDKSDLQPAGEALGFPLILKTRRSGYDGKGQRVVKDSNQLETAWSEIGERPAIAEGFVNFIRELSIIAVFGKNAQSAYYPLVENEHENGILVKSMAPAEAKETISKQARAAVDAIAKHYSYVGVLVAEFFQVGDKLLLNEIAPRVHNSGHWTIEGAL